MLNVRENYNGVGYDEAAYEVYFSLTCYFIAAVQMF
jgi:hypothetical protein